MLHLGKLGVEISLVYTLYLFWQAARGGLQVTVIATPGTAG